jgi:Ran GTPase-activating protein (RanGAP) involved in mRNA processing and transport
MQHDRWDEVPQDHFHYSTNPFQESDEVDPPAILAPAAEVPVTAADVVATVDTQDVFRREMELRFPGAIPNASALKDRLAFVDDDIITAVDLSRNAAVDSESCHELLPFLFALAQEDQRRCKEIDLSDTSVGTDVVKLIMHLLTKSPCMSTLSLRNLSPKQADWRSIAENLGEAVKASPSLTSIDISRNPFGDEFLKPFVDAVSVSNLNRVSLNSVGLSIAPAVEQAFRNVEHLDLGGNSFDLSRVQWESLTKLRTLILRRADAVGTLENLDRCRILQKLDLSGTKLNDAAASNLGRLLEKTASLSTLKIADCGLSDAAVVTVLQSIQSNQSLAQEVDLSRAASAFPCDALWQATCKRLLRTATVLLRESSLTSAHVEELVRAFYESPLRDTVRLRELDVHGNTLNEEGADWIGELIALPTLHVLNCGNNNISDGTPIYEALCNVVQAKREFTGEVVGAGAGANTYTKMQHEWMLQHGFKKLQTGYNAEARPFVPAVEALPATEVPRAFGGDSDMSVIVPRRFGQDS